MKEIGKLIELLNEYDKEKGLHTFWKTTQSNKIQIYGKGVCSESYLYSKSYGFIEWLIDNDKINLAKLEIGLLRYGIPEDTLGFYEGLLMLLSISDTPIEDLLLYLK